MTDAKEKLKKDKKEVQDRFKVDKKQFVAFKLGKEKFRETIQWRNSRITSLNKKFLAFRDRTRKTYKLIKKRNAKRDKSRKEELIKTKAKALKLLKEVKESARRQDELIKR